VLRLEFLCDMVGENFSPHPYARKNERGGRSAKAYALAAARGVHPMASPEALLLRHRMYTTNI
jgi:hypothetical protein